MDNIVFITGASSGIGMSSAKLFAKNRYNLILTARRYNIIKDLSEQLENEFKIKCLPIKIDVRDRRNITDEIENLPKGWENISILINNAGLALGLNSIDNGNYEDWETMIDTNIKGLLYISEAIIPLMKKNNKGHIINIGSIAGKEVYHKGNVYCATKHAVDAITKSMRIDLLDHNIKVTQVAPGATETEFSLVRYNGDNVIAKHSYDGYTPLNPDDVAEVILFCANRPENVNINDILVMPKAQASAGTFNKFK